MGDVTILVNNAAVVHGKSLMSSDDNALLKTQHVNTLGQFWVSQDGPEEKRVYLLKREIPLYFGYCMAVEAAGHPDLSVTPAFRVG